MIGYCFAENNWIKIENIKVEINNLPNELSGLKIAHIFDVHLPQNASNVDSIVNKVIQEKPDIIFNNKLNNFLLNRSVYIIKKLEY